MPTCGLLGKYQLGYNIDFYPQGGIIGTARFSPFKRFMLGFSYGGNKIIGTETPDWLPHIGLNGRVRILEESYTFPAFAVGFNSQGIPPYNQQRYHYKSPGIYLVASKNYGLLGGNLSFHGGLNYTLEDSDDEGPDLFGGGIYIFNFARLSAEYRLGLDDNIETRGRGYFNLSVGFLGDRHFQFTLFLLDILENKRDETGLARGLRFGFVKSF